MLNIYLFLCIWFGVFSFIRGWSFWSGFFVSLICTPLIGWIFNVIRGPNMYNERGRSWIKAFNPKEKHMWDDSPSPDKYWQNNNQPEQQEPQVESWDGPWDDHDDIAERRRRDYYRDRGQIKDNY